ncbi:hypothetical protein N752_18445 [Desulforamulus aquiferis]|nr:hypothetical protein N752_18445 [Desulforamulus aquiferis]
MAGGRAVNCVIEEAFDTEKYHPFKGNFHLERLKDLIKETGPGNIAGIIITVTCNSAGGQPVSMENIRETSKIAKEYGIRVFFDAARCYENAFFIKTREEGYKDKTIPEIVKEMFAYADGFTMSAKKDAIVNIGGILAIKEDEDLYNRCAARTVPMEGFITYGGLAGRDMEQWPGVFTKVWILITWTTE